MAIAFITDLHLELDYEFPFGIDTRKNFQRIIKAAQKLPIDQIIFGGDICYREPRKEIYAWLVDEMSAIGINYECIAGNHDNSLWLAEALGKEDWIQKEEFFFAQKNKNHLFVYLDSSQGSISDEQFKWLSRQLYQHKKVEVVIFMHHPPIDAGVPYMDKRYDFKGEKELMSLLHSHGNPISIFTGHYHVEKTILSKNVSIFITPSCFFQLNQYSEEFKVDHHRIAMRLIDLNREVLKTTVHYLAGSRT